MERVRSLEADHQRQENRLQEREGRSAGVGEMGEGLPSSSGGLNSGQQEERGHSGLRQVFVGQGSPLWPQCSFHDSGGEGGLPAERGPVERLWVASGGNLENP